MQEGMGIWGRYKRLPCPSRTEEVMQGSKRLWTVLVLALGFVLLTKVCTNPILELRTNRAGRTSP